jgi:hypothetical protein
MMRTTIDSTTRRPSESRRGHHPDGIELSIRLIHTSGGSGAWRVHRSQGQHTNPAIWPGR